jgi:hypothetical protein
LRILVGSGRDRCCNLGRRSVNTRTIAIIALAVAVVVVVILLV